MWERKNSQRKKIPLNPPFSKGEIPLFEKEGAGEILYVTDQHKM
jgi:hypothetical protein